jgi:cytochrome c peroxidase
MRHLPINGDSNYATMRFEPESLHGANAGLQVARAIMEEVKKEFDWISYGDLWTLAGVAAIQVGDCIILCSRLISLISIQEMAGPKIPWRPGRIDGFSKDVTPDGRLPDAAQGQDHLRAVCFIIPSPVETY